MHCCSSKLTACRHGHGLLHMRPCSLAYYYGTPARAAATSCLNAKLPLSTSNVRSPCGVMRQERRSAAVTAGVGPQGVSPSAAHAGRKSVDWQAFQRRRVTCRLQVAAARTARQRRRSAAATAARRRAARPAPSAAPGRPRRPRARTRPARWPARTRAAAPPGPAYARVVRLCACLLPYITMTAGCFGYTSPRRRCGLHWLHGRALSIGSSPSAVSGTVR